MKQKVLSLFVLVLCQYSHVFAQNVFSPSDSIVTYNAKAPSGSISNPVVPSDGRMVKWIRTIADTTLINWNTGKFKCYFGAGFPFRLRYPNNYNPANATKYPIVVFFHGGGESRPATDNELHLFWGAQFLEQLMNEGKWNGFLLFSQVPTVLWDKAQIQATNTIVDSLVKYANVDGNKALSIGLSSGGNAAVLYSELYPKRVTTCITSSPAYIRGLNNDISKMLQIPTWMGNSGKDYNPTPYDVISFTDLFRDSGGMIYTSYFAANDRVIWDLQWKQKDVSGNYLLLNYLNNISKSQPIVYFRNNSFCQNTAINAKMGLTAGFAAYEWQYDNGGGFVTIGNASGNEYTATQAGKYRARIKFTTSSGWSEWSPNPINIISKNCSSDTVFTEGFETTNPYYYASAAYKPRTFDCQNGIAYESAYALTQDGTGVIGKRFLLHTTATNSASTLCNYSTADQVWRTFTPPAVIPNTNYELSFSLANQADVNRAKIIPRINFTNLSNIAAAVSGDGIWQKFTYSWNSGTATTADIDFINQNNLTDGNDFAIDEITLIKKDVTTVPCALPTSVSTIDIGNTALQGSVCFTSPSNYLVKGSGDDIWGNADAFRYVYKSFTGDGTVDVKVSSQDASYYWNKAGVMIRESLSNNSRNAYIALTSANGATFQYRSLSEGYSSYTATSGFKAPYYVRLQRVGNTFTGFISADGTAWQQVGATTIAMGTSVYAGLAVTSHDNSKLSTVSFDQWRVNNTLVNSSSLSRRIAQNVITRIPESESPFIRILPNPAVKNFVVDFTIATRQNLVLRITGADGRLFYTESINNFAGTYRKNFDKLNLSKGMYAITLTTDKGSKTNFLVKE